MSSLAIQWGVTEFHHKNGIALSLMGQGGTHNPNVTLRGYPKKFWGLFGEVSHIAQENFCDWPVCKNEHFSLACKNEHFSLVEMSMAIFQPIFTLIQ